MAAPDDAPTLYTMPAPRGWALGDEDRIVDGDIPETELAQAVALSIWHLFGHGPNHPGMLLFDSPDGPWVGAFEQKPRLSPFCRSVEVWALMDGDKDEHTAVDVELGAVTEPTSFNGADDDSAEPFDTFGTQDLVQWRLVALIDVGDGTALAEGEATLTIEETAGDLKLWAVCVHELHNSILEQAA